MNKCIICNTQTKTRKYCSPRCKSQIYNSAAIQLKRGMKRKIEAVKNLGGKCSHCGYDKNLSSLTFHHINPQAKIMSLDLRKFANCKPHIIQEELSKCILVCRNCHGEIEYPHFNNWQ